jgi:hypothetical protein
MFKKSQRFFALMVINITKVTVFNGFIIDSFFANNQQIYKK